MTRRLVLALLLLAAPAFAQSGNPSNAHWRPATEAELQADPPAARPRPRRAHRDRVPHRLRHLRRPGPRRRRRPAHHRRLLRQRQVLLLPAHPGPPPHREDHPAPGQLPHRLDPRRQRAPRHPLHRRHRHPRRRSHRRPQPRHPPRRVLPHLSPGRPLGPPVRPLHHPLLPPVINDCPPHHEASRVTGERRDHDGACSLK